MIKTIFDIRSDSGTCGCFAFDLKSKLEFKLSVFGCECAHAWLYVGNDERVLLSAEAHVISGAEGFSASYSLSANGLTGAPGLFFCHFEFVDPAGRRHYTSFGAGSECILTDSFENEAQFLLTERIYTPPAWFACGAVYQIFPDRFAPGGKAEKKPGAVYNGDWENGIPEYPQYRGQDFKNNTHFGGTLWGAAEKLPYLRTLGITCVYLNPIHKAASNHKYDIGDYLNVDESFGGNEALRYFIKRAHSFGVSVILDGVFNHVGEDSVYFNRRGSYDSVGAYQSRQSPYSEWFSFSQFPDEYDAWWGIKLLPRTVRCRSFTDFITKKVVPFYMEMGVDGWRLDVVDELESGFVSELVSAIKKCKSDAIVIGEVWEDASNKTAYGERKPYFLGAQLDSVMNYPLRNALIDFVMHGESQLLVDTVRTLYRHYPVENQRFLLNFLGSHDTERITTVLGGDGENGLDNDENAVRRLSKQDRARAIKLLKSAYILLAAMPGVPCLFYGDEIAMEGHHDPFNRRPFPPSGFSNGLSAFFGRVNTARKAFSQYFSLAELKIGSFDNGCVRITRTDGKKTLVALANMGDKGAFAEIPGNALDILNGKHYNSSVALAPKTAMILVSEDKNER